VGQPISNRVARSDCCGSAGAHGATGRHEHDTRVERKYLGS
jgi:hypothetical protein